MKKVVNDYDRSVHTTGRIWIVAALMVMLAVPVVIGLENKALPDWMVVLRGLLAVAPIPICEAAKALGRRGRRASPERASSDRPRLGAK